MHSPSRMWRVLTHITRRMLQGCHAHAKPWGTRGRAAKLQAHTRAHAEHEGPGAVGVLVGVRRGAVARPQCQRRAVPPQLQACACARVPSEPTVHACRYGRVQCLCCRNAKNGHAPKNTHTGSGSWEGCMHGGPLQDVRRLRRICGRPQGIRQEKPYQSR